MLLHCADLPSTVAWRTYTTAKSLNEINQKIANSAMLVLE